MVRNHGTDSTKQLTAKQYQDCLAWAEFVPPKDEPKKETKPAASKKATVKENGQEEALAKCLALVKGATKKDFAKVKAQVISMCGVLQSADISKVTIALSAKQIQYRS